MAESGSLRASAEWNERCSFSGAILRHFMCIAHNFPTRAAFGVKRRFVFDAPLSTTTRHRKVAGAEFFDIRFDGHRFVQAGFVASKTAAIRPDNASIRTMVATGSVFP